MSYPFHFLVSQRGRVARAAHLAYDLINVAGQNATFNGCLPELVLARQLNRWYQATAMVSPLSTPGKVLGFFGDCSFPLLEVSAVSKYVEPACFNRLLCCIDSEKRVQVQLKVLRGSEHGLNGGLIPQSTWTVLDNLRIAGTLVRSLMNFCGPW